MNSDTSRRAAMNLRAPLTLRWRAKGEYGYPLVSGDRVVVHDFSGGIVCFDDGRESWRYRGDVGILIAGATIIGTGDERLTELDLASGKVVRSVECPWDISSVGEHLFPERRAFLGRRSVDEGEGIKVTELALVDLHNAQPLWSVSSRGRSDEVFGMSVACGDGQVFVCKGNTLIALDLESGAQRWAAPLGEFPSGTMWYLALRPMVSTHRVVISLPRGVGAFDTATGKLVWSTPGHHATVVYGGRVYSQDTWRFGVLDLNDGRVLLEANPQSLVEKKWGFKRVNFQTGLAVSETHFFMGDGEGRLYAFEKETAEPVWHHRPKGGNPYFGNIPVIANNRLYITTVKPGPYTPTARTHRPGSLYCYEGAGS